MRTEIETVAEALHSRGERIIPKIVIAVHGIGDQVRNTTIQQVAAQFCRHYGQEVPISLGEFDAGPVSATAVVMLQLLRGLNFSIHLVC